MGMEVEYSSKLSIGRLWRVGTGVFGCKWVRNLWHGDGFSVANLASRWKREFVLIYESTFRHVTAVSKKNYVSFRVLEKPSFHSGPRRSLSTRPPTSLTNLADPPTRSAPAHPSTNPIPSVQDIHPDFHLVHNHPQGTLPTRHIVRLNLRIFNQTRLGSSIGRACDSYFLS